jgi:hypothetical protein
MREDEESLDKIMVVEMKYQNLISLVPKPSRKVRLAKHTRKVNKLKTR